MNPDAGPVDGGYSTNSQKTKMMISADAQTPSTQNTSNFFPLLYFVYVELATVYFNTIDDLAQGVMASHRCHVGDGLLGAYEETAYVDSKVVVGNGVIRECIVLSVEEAPLDLVEVVDTSGGFQY